MSYYTTLYGTYGRLELALKDTSKMNNLYDKTISTLCMGLYYFYHNSALNRAMLHRSYEASIKSDEDTKQKLLMPSRAGGTRWINLAVSIYNMYVRFLFLIGYCLKKSSPLKLLGKMEPNLAGNIYVRSSKAFSFGSKMAAVF